MLRSALRSILVASALGAACTQAHAGTLSGEVWLEMEYLGESFFSELRYTSEDLGLPDDNLLVVVDTTRFAQDTWLPGPRLAFTWKNAPDSANPVEIASRTSFNSERFFQELRFLGVRPSGKGAWKLQATANLREESRSLVGHGDWSAQLDLQREQRWGDLRGALRGIWQHTRSRGDTTSYLFDYDLGRLRASLIGGGGWLPSWEAYVEGVLKEVPGTAVGSYTEGRAGTTWRFGGTRYRTLDLTARLRDYRDADGPGRDFFATGLEFHGEAARWGTQSSLPVNAEVVFTNYQGTDALYYDTLESHLFVPWRWDPSPWSWSLGPSLRWLRDLDGTDRDYFQSSLRTVVSRLIGLGGYGEVTVDAGYRNYRNEAAEFVEISELSSSFLRSDYWLLELLAVINIPVGSGFSVDLLGNTSWEFHTQESERIQITLVNVGVSRRF